MGQTVFSTSSPLKKKVWEEKLFRELVEDSFVNQFMGTTSKSVIQTKNALEKDKGDEIVFGLRKKLEGDGVEDDVVLEGNEEALSASSDSVTLKKFRHAVRDNGEMTRKRVFFDIDDESQGAISDWGTEKINRIGMNALGVGRGVVTAQNPTHVLYPEDSAGTFSLETTYATALGDINTTNSKITPAFLTALYTWAKNGGNRTIEPLKPVSVDGRNCYLLLTADDIYYDMKRNEEFRNATQYARERGPKNPLFQNADIIYNDILIYTHEYVKTGTDGGSGSTPYARGVLLGQQALMWAWGRRGKVIKKTFDYESQHGYAYDFVAGVKKPKFDSKDYGSVGLIFARSQISDVS